MSFKMQYSVAEVLEAARKLKSVDEKVNYLQTHESVPLKTVLKYMYDPSEKCLLPEGDPPYTPSEFPDAQGMLYTENRRLRIFYEGNGYDDLHPLKREVLFINILEAVDRDDAKILVKMKDKKKITGITAATINKAFPNLVPEAKKK
jgi:hypothetical protein